MLKLIQAITAEGEKEIQVLADLQPIYLQDKENIKNPTSKPGPSPNLQAQSNLV